MVNKCRIGGDLETDRTDPSLGRRGLGRLDVGTWMCDVGKQLVDVVFLGF